MIVCRVVPLPLLVAAVVLSSAACGGESPRAASSTSQRAASSAEIPSPVVLAGFVSDQTVAFVHPEDREVVKTLSLDGEPWSVAATPDGRRAYVGFWGGGSVTQGIAVIDVPGGSVAGSIRVGETEESLVRSLEVSPDGRFLYALERYSRTLLVFETADHELVARVEGAGTEDVEVSPDGDRVYVSGPVLTVVETAGHTVVDVVDLGGVSEGMAVTPDGAFLYVAQPGRVSVVATATGSVIETIDTPFGGDPPETGSGPADAVITPDGTYAYRTSTCCGTVAVIETATRTVAGTVAVGSGPSRLSVTPDGSTVFVTNSASGTVSAVETATYETRDTGATGRFPVPVAVASY